MQAVSTKIAPIFLITILKTIQNLLFLYLIMNCSLCICMFVCEATCLGRIGPQGVSCTGINLHELVKLFYIVAAVF